MRDELVPVSDDEVLVAQHMAISTGYLHGVPVVALHVHASDLDGDDAQFVLMVETDDADWLSDVLARVATKLRSTLN